MPEQVQGLGIVRVEGEQFAVARFGVGQLALLMQFEDFLQHGSQSEGRGAGAGSGGGMGNYAVSCRGPPPVSA